MRKHNLVKNWVCQFKSFIWLSSGDKGAGGEEYINYQSGLSRVEL